VISKQSSVIEDEVSAFGRLFYLLMTDNRSLMTDY
jgi:hypothetical protein